MTAPVAEEGLEAEIAGGRRYYHHGYDYDYPRYERKYYYGRDAEAKEEIVLDHVNEEAQIEGYAYGRGYGHYYGPKYEASYDGPRYDYDGGYGRRYGRYY